MKIILDLIAGNEVVNIVSYSPSILLQIASELENAVMYHQDDTHSPVLMDESKIILTRMPFHDDLNWILFIQGWLSMDVRPKLVIWSTVPVTLTDDEVTVTLNEGTNDTEIRQYMRDRSSKMYHLDRIESTARLIVESYSTLPGNYLVYLPTLVEVNTVKTLLKNVGVVSNSDRRIYLVTPETDIEPRESVDVVFDTQVVLLPVNNDKSSVPGYEIKLIGISPEERVYRQHQTQSIYYAIGSELPSDYKIPDIFILRSRLNSNSTEEEKFILSYPLQLDMSRTIWKWSRLGLPLFPCLVITSIIDSYGPGYYQYPLKKSDQDPSQYQIELDKFRQVFYLPYRGRSDIETFLNMWTDLTERYNGIPNDEQLREWCSLHTLNYDSWKRALSRLREIMSISRKIGLDVETGPFTISNVIDSLRLIWAEIYSDRMLTVGETMFSHPLGETMFSHPLGETYVLTSSR